MRIVFRDTYVPYFDPDCECISDDKINPLQEDPKGFQLCYNAIPHHFSFTQKRADKLEEKRNRMRSSEAIEIPEDQEKFLQGENQPIPIKNEHELAHLYLNDAYSRLVKCDIFELDLDALLTILSRASCFPQKLRTLAASVRQNVRNRWLCSNIEDWTKASIEEANTELHKLALHVPGALETLALPQANLPARRFYSSTFKSIRGA